MDPQPDDAIPSTASMDGHPFHPALVPFPIAFLIGALLADLAFWGSGDEFWARAAAWLVGAGLVGGAVAALAGLTDYFGDARVRALTKAKHHFIGNATVLVLALISLILRLSQGAAEGALPWGLVLSVVIALILSYTGWLGGELAFRHRVGVIPRSGPLRRS
jgi:uncharacterized membrane protein